MSNFYKIVRGCHGILMRDNNVSHGHRFLFMSSALGRTDDIKIVTKQSSSSQKPDGSRRKSTVYPANTEKRLAGILRRDITLPTDAKGKLAFVLNNVLTKEECDGYIKKTEEEIGYEDALVNTGGGRQRLITEVRKSSRCILDSEENAGLLWKRIREHVPSVWKKKNVVGLNERLRFLRYDPGQYFLRHKDGSYVRQNKDRSYITVQFYLNKGYTGGRTVFRSWEGDERIEIIHKTGMALVFQHDILHEGETLTQGRKYTLRTDVMYEADQIND